MFGTAIAQPPRRLSKIVLHIGISVKLLFKRDQTQLLEKELMPCVAVKSTHPEKVAYRENNKIILHDIVTSRRFGLPELNQTLIDDF